MESIEFLPYTKDYLPYGWAGINWRHNHDLKRWLKHNPSVIFEVVDLLMMTLPSPRDDFYKDPDIDTIKKRVFDYTNEVLNAISFFKLYTRMSLLDRMELYSFGILYIGLISNIVIILFITIATLLIYSLLMNSVETKTYEFGVMRMVGLSRRGLILLVATQAIFFTMPAIIASFILSVPVLAGVYTFKEGSAFGYGAAPIPSFSSILIALAIGLVIPAISSIIPMQRLLANNLSESLNSHSRKLTGFMITFYDVRKGNHSILVLFGGISVIFGTSLYYFLPKAFLMLNFSLLLNLFFMILSGFLLGLTLLVNNLQGLLEQTLSRLLLFWEAKAMQAVLHKNLAAHKSKNNLTSIIYSLTLGCIIFL